MIQIQKDREPKLLVIGACGQIGTELVPALEKQYGSGNVVAADVRDAASQFTRYVKLDVLNHEQLDKLVCREQVTQVYLLAAMLSAKGEQSLDLAWKLNVHSLLSVLRIAQERGLDKVFWPSSIAVFGPGSPKYNCPQQTRIEPNTVYGISKRAGEYWCNYYAEKFGVDVRSLRYPGLVSYSAPAGGGTTDYAVEIFHRALEEGRYTCFLEETTCLPMMYMPDAIRATLELMGAPKEKIKIRTSYNLAAMSFAPCDLVAEIKKYIPRLKVVYHPDMRQAIADSWPASIKDIQAREDWGWNPAFDLSGMTADMLERLCALKNLSLPESPKITRPYPDFVDFE